MSRTYRQFKKIKKSRHDITEGEILTRAKLDGKSDEQKLYMIHSDKNYFNSTKRNAKAKEMARRISRTNSRKLSNSNALRHAEMLEMEADYDEALNEAFGVTNGYN